MIDLDQIPTPVQNQMLCLDHWVEPENFTTMSSKERLQLMRDLYPRAKPPTSDNFWVWFGTYATPRATPRYGNDSVPRVLFEIFRGKLGEGKRLKYRFGTTSDVNPFKYWPSAGRSRQEVEQISHVLHPTTPTTTPTLAHAIDPSTVTRILAAIDDYWMDGVTDTPTTLVQMLTQLQYPMPEIKKALTEHSKTKDWEPLP